MSFGVSPSDVFLLLQLCTKAYQGWRDACGNYAAITGRLDAFTGLIERLEDEAKRSDGLLKRKGHDYAGLHRVLRNSHETVTELFQVVTKYGSLSRTKSSNWDRILFAYTDISYLHRKLDVHITEVTAFLSAVGISALGRIEKSSRELPAMHKAINRLAYQIRADGDEDENMTVYVDDDPSVWRELRRELVKEGFRSDSIRLYKHELKQYAAELSRGKKVSEKAAISRTMGKPNTLSRPRGYRSSTFYEESASKPSKVSQDGKQALESVRQSARDGSMYEKLEKGSEELCWQFLCDDEAVEQDLERFRRDWQSCRNDPKLQDAAAEAIRVDLLRGLRVYEAFQKELREGAAPNFQKRCGKGFRTAVMR